MKKLILASAITAIFASGAALAQEKKPDNEFSFNIGAASEYRYRGIMQSRGEPALSGGADYTNNPTGLYAGTWASTIKWIDDAGGGAKNVEVDLYGGKKGDLGKGFGYDVGGLYYWYPGNDLDKVAGFENANTFELYGKISYGAAYVKYSHSLTDTFGWVDSKNSNYVDVGYDHDLGSGYTLNLHVGHQEITGSRNTDYTDYKIGVSKEFYGVGFSLAYITTDAESSAYYYSTPSGGAKGTGNSTIVLTATKTF
ncbi:MAG: hypothetical protein C4516_07425 [Oxalobacter sp.]|nr:MAG: hypothetical protein C4516_07425 [Oxalobacter sp.]